MLFKILFFILGSFIGSFLNVCIYRMPRSKSIIFPRSQCARCGALIRWHENIPLLSFLVLRGRCSSCKKPISLRYPIVESLTAILFTLLYSKFGLGPDLLVYLIFVCGLIIATFIDFEYQLIPDSVSLGGLVIGLTASVVKSLGVNSYFPIMNSLAGALIGGLSTYVLAIFGKLLFREKLKEIKEDAAMGFGDVKFLAMIGAFLGWRKVVLVFFLAAFLGAVAGLILRIRYKIEVIPYGPYLSMAAVIAVLWGDRIVEKLFLYF